MQRAVSAEREIAPTSGKPLPPSDPAATPVGQFVINLCASTTPMALGQNSHPALKRFKFFVSRRREDGRERFRMHLGFFASQEDAESLLPVVREFYPAAWAGVAPGQKLRNEAAAAAAAAAGLAQPSIHDISVVAVSEPAVAEVAAAPAAPEAVAAAPLTAPAPAAPTAIDYAPEAPSAPLELTLVQQPPRSSPTSRALEAVRAAISSLEDSGARSVPTVKPVPELKASTSGSYPSLDDSQVLRVLEAPSGAPHDPRAAGRGAPAPAATSAPAHTPAPASKTEPANASAPGSKSAAASTSAPARMRAAAPAATITATSAAQPRQAPAAPSNESSGERTVIAPAYMPTPKPQPQGQVAAYAVQLIWSVQPIDVATVPQLAIFAAYTLYAAEGNRDGRRWYGLRLGFFTDPVSARQVAQYVRSEFNSVSVVPVTAREAERAASAPPRPFAPAPTAAAKPAGDAAATPHLTTKPDEEFRLLDSRPRQVPVTPAPPGKPAGKSAPGKRAKLRPAAADKSSDTARTGKHRRAPLTLEETLEILGAGELQVAENRVELLNDSGVRHLSQQAMKPASSKGSRFSRLMDRLSERKSS
ncbi:MAG TPA: hypothetical protein VMI92_09875 [Steroidobacteraceae bacterium]|nr:hypothetical protein [Steroidobacteraceae bacterium]